MKARLKHVDEGVGRVLRLGVRREVRVRVLPEATKIMPGHIGHEVKGWKLTAQDRLVWRSNNLIQDAHGRSSGGSGAGAGSGGVGGRRVDEVTDGDAILTASGFREGLMVTENRSRGGDWLGFAAEEMEKGGMVGGGGGGNSGLVVVVVGGVLVLQRTVLE